jgi:hypothetical protein
LLKLKYALQAFGVLRSRNVVVPKSRLVMVAVPAPLSPKNSVAPAGPPLLRLVIWALPALLVEPKTVNPPVSLTMVVGLTLTLARLLSAKEVNPK